MSARSTAPDDAKTYSSFLELVNRYPDNVNKGALHPAVAAAKIQRQFRSKCRLQRSGRCPISKSLIRTYWIGPAMVDRGGVVSLVGAGDAIGAAGAWRLPWADTRPPAPGATRPQSKKWSRVDGRAA